MVLSEEGKVQLLALARNNPEISYTDLSRVFNISKQRVSVICRANGVDRMAYLKEKQRRSTAVRHEAHEEKARQAHIAWKNRPPEIMEERQARDRVRSLCYSNIASGKLVKEDCEVCDSPAANDANRKRALIEAHHDDYSKPLSIRWLCKPCHVEWHKHNKALPALPIADK